MKKLILFPLIMGSLFLNTACDSDELVAGAIGVGIGVGVGRHYDRHHDRRRHRDRWILNEEMQATASSSTQAFAQRHNLPLSSATKIANAFNGLDSNGLASFATIGLNQKDLQAMAMNGMPEPASVQNMAGKLGISNGHARTLLTELNRKFAVASSNINSDYWQACMDKGTWRTPQNNYCRQTFWNGCSPETGARVCY